MQFIDFCRMHGVIIDSTPPQGVWRRYKTEDKPHHRNGAVKFMGDHGFVQNHATMTEVALWQSDLPSATPTPAEQKKRESEMRARRAREARERAGAISSMRRYFFGLPAFSGGHPYLAGKGLSPRGCEGLRIDGDKLVIPMWIGDALMSLQTIDADGAKLYRAGCPVAGASLCVGPQRPSLTCWAEGFATGLAVHQCIPKARVVVCFDAGNLVKVAQAAKVRGLAVVCADNDWKGSVNTGVDKGRAAAEAIGCGLAYPKGIDGTDWADAFKEWGSAAKVRVEVMRGAKVVSGVAA